MRPATLVGIILAALGAIVLVRGLDYKTTSEVVKVGDVRITNTDSQRIPQWVGIAALVVGLGAIGAGVTKRV